MPGQGRVYYESPSDNLLRLEWHHHWSVREKKKKGFLVLRFRKIQKYQVPAKLMTARVKSEDREAFPVRTLGTLKGKPSATGC